MGSGSQGVAVLSGKPHGPGPAASAGLRRCAGPIGRLPLPGGQQPWDEDELLSEAGDERSAFSRPATPSAVLCHCHGHSTH